MLNNIEQDVSIQLKYIILEQVNSSCSWVVALYVGSKLILSLGIWILLAADGCSSFVYLCCQH